MMRGRRWSRGECPVCFRDIAVSSWGGQFQPHNMWRSARRCPGSGLTPEQAAEWSL